MTKTALIIPALNEAGNIAGLVREIRKLDLPGIELQVVVVDNGSTDDTASLAGQAGAQVVHEPRRGYGFACMAGASAAASAEVLAFMDGDYSSLPSELPQVLGPVLSGRADLVQGSRELGGIAPGAMPIHQKLGNRLAIAVINRLYGVKLTDLGPFRAIRADLFWRMEMREMTYGWTAEMTVKAVRMKARLVEAPVSYHPRRAGRSKVSGTLRGTILAAWFIFGVTLRYAIIQPNKEKT